MNLSPMQKKLFDESVNLLNTIGYRITDQRILDTLAAAGVKIEGTTVYFTEAQIVSALESAPKSFTLRARDSKKDTVIGEGKPKLATGYGCTYVIDRDGTRRDANFDDYINFAKLVQTSGCHDFNGGILVQPEDLSTSICYPAMLYAAIALSDMPLIGFSAGEQEMRQSMELAEIAYGGSEKFRSDYYVLSLVNTLAPFRLGDGAERTLLVAAEYNQPVIISPGLTAGSSTPVTSAGTILQGNLEMIAAITVAQILKPGLPVIYGFQPTILDMRTGAFCTSNPINERNRKAAREFAKAYGLPYRNSGSLTDARVVGIQSTYEGLYGMQNVMRDNNSFTLHASGVLNSTAAMSYEKFVVDCEHIRNLTSYMEPIDYADEYWCLDDMKEIGIGGNYIETESTLEYFRAYTFEPALCKMADVKDENPSESDKNFIARAVKIKEAWLENYTPPALDLAVREKLEAYLVDVVGVDKEVIDRIYA